MADAVQSAGNATRTGRGPSGRCSSRAARPRRPVLGALAADAAISVAISVLFVDGDAARLGEMLAIAREARLSRTEHGASTSRSR